MSVVVTEAGFAVDAAVEDIFEIDTATRVEALDACLTKARVHIHADNFSDGRIFTLARQLRVKGYAGVIRGVCDLLPDQFAMALRSGLDEVQISAHHAARCDEPQWLARVDWRVNDYQARLRGS
ncbi:MAG: DUF934 domain-containing protein [Pseudomonadales bacterium]